MERTLSWVSKKSSPGFVTWLTLTLSRDWFPGDEKNKYAVSTWLFLRVLALIYLFQFISLSTQVIGLIGNQGIAPAGEVITLAIKEHAAVAMLRYPTLFWYGTPDFLMLGVCCLGVLASILLFVGIFAGAALIALYVCFLSCASVGGEFFSFIGDRLLLEAGFLAMFLTSFRLWMPFRRTPSPPKMVRYLLWWLLFRIHVQSAIYDCADATHYAGALSFSALFYQNQSLPSWPSWYLHQLPAPFHWIYASLWLAVRIVCSVLIIAPRQHRHRAALVFVLFELIPFLAGNYTHFSLTVMALCLFLLDDAFWIELLPLARERIEQLAGNKYRGFSVVTRRTVLSILLALTGLHFGQSFFPSAARFTNLNSLLAIFSSFGVVDRYAFEFTQEEFRPELRVEGSPDGENWRPYEFHWKPESPKRLSPILASHHPRLDWQMAYAAGSPASKTEWVSRFCHRLLEGSAPVLDLLQENPFPYSTPQVVRILRYEHRFTEISTKDEGWWTPPSGSKDTLYMECRKP
ncbi:MAG TPA: lipase maturation factor family protein [Bdellovibrionota bacterium]|nr:lipase maturation factor family protein [Bdellovibrionota bacterium]